MATTPEGTTQLLDQLQHELNSVVEHVAKIFVAYNHDPTTRPAAQGNKLKAMLPGANNNFHTALDQLEHELQLAKLVMRRDLAVCRERSGIVKPAPVTGTVAPADAPKVQDDKQPDPSTSSAAQPPLTDDVAMEDVQPDQEIDMTEVPTEDAKPQQTSDETTNTEEKVTSPAKVASPDQITTDDNPTTTDAALHIDTQSQPKPKPGEPTQGEDDIPPDTGTFSNTNDLDSLFGGPTSAGPGDGGDFSADASNNMEFDFDSFGANLDTNGADNDNITSLLPGLQDYANNQADDAHATDFENIFDMNSVPMDSQNVPGDNTFEDLLDFEDFTGGDFGGGEGGQNGNSGTDFDFSFD